MAPEVFMKSESSGHGRAVDIWSVGCCIIEMASGRRPWSDYDSNYQIMFKVILQLNALFYKVKQFYTYNYNELEKIKIRVFKLKIMEFKNVNYLSYLLQEFIHISETF